MNLCVICFGFQEENLRKQPWRYVYELSTNLDEYGITPWILTDCETDAVEGIPVKSVDQLHSGHKISDAVVDGIQKESPDIVASLLGPTSFYRRPTLASRLDVPVVGILGSPIYTPSDLWRVGASEVFRHPKELVPHALGSVAPNVAMRQRLNALDHIVTTSLRDEKRLEQAGIDTRISTIPTAIGQFDLELPDESRVGTARDELHPDGGPLILYFTSPLTLRGTDTLLEAFAATQAATDGQLVFLSRQDDGGLGNEEAHLQRVAKQCGVADSFTLIPRNLSPDGVKAHVSAADVVSLPYKLTISNLPISILETMALGKPLVSTTVGGIPEVVPGTDQLVEPDTPSALATALDNFAYSPERADRAGRRNRQRMEAHPQWDDVRCAFATTLQEVLE